MAAAAATREIHHDLDEIRFALGQAAEQLDAGDRRGAADTIDTAAIMLRLVARTISPT